MENKKIAITLILVAILAVIVLTSPLFSTENDVQDRDMQSNDFTLPNLEGEEITLSDYEGKVTVINFMGTECGACQDEMSELREVHQEFGEEIVLLSIGADTRENLMDFKSNYNANWQFLRDLDGEAFQEYGVENIPTIIIFDKEGEMVYSHTGKVTSNTLMEEIQNHM